MNNDLTEIMFILSTLTCFPNDCYLMRFLVLFKSLQETQLYRVKTNNHYFLNQWSVPPPVWLNIDERHVNFMCVTAPCLSLSPLANNCSVVSPLICKYVLLGAHLGLMAKISAPACSPFSRLVHHLLLGTNHSITLPLSFLCDWSSLQLTFQSRSPKSTASAISEAQQLCGCDLV